MPPPIETARTIEPAFTPDVPHATGHHVTIENRIVPYTATRNIYTPAGFFDDEKRIQAFGEFLGFTHTEHFQIALDRLNRSADKAHHVYKGYKRKDLSGPRIKKHIHDITDKQLEDGVSALFKSNPHVTEWTVSVPSLDTSITHFSFHTDETDDMQQISINQSIVRTMAVIHDTCGIPPRSHLTVFRVAGGDYTKPAETNWFGTVKPMESSALRETLRVEGQTFNGLGVMGLYEEKRPGELRTERAKYNEEIAKHETGHWMDPYLKIATVVQSEGFSQAAVHGFDFAKAVDDLRKDDYGRPISSGQICELFSEEADQREVPWTERYKVSPTFFSYLYTRFKEDNPYVMVDWYSYVSGARPAYGISLRGDTEGALAVAMGDGARRADAQAVIKDYIAEMNKTVAPAFRT